MKKTFIFLSIFTFSILASVGKEKKYLPKDKLIEKMQNGGLVLYFRHASTEKDYADQINANVNDGSTQRVLSEKGWHEAVDIGRAIKYHKIPVSNVLTSEYFRAWQTAWLAFGKYEKKEVFNFLPHEDYTKEQMAIMKKRVTPFLATKHKLRGNLVIVAHDDPFEAATGIYPEPMGVCFVVQPLGDDQFRIIGQISPMEW